MKQYALIFITSMTGLYCSKEPIVTAEKFLDHKRSLGHLAVDFKAPETVLVCYQSSTMQYLLKNHPEFKASPVSHFHFLDDGKVGILGDWGVGAPGLAIKIEELIVLGAKRFIAVGTAGSLMNSHAIADFVLCPKALAEDGVAHHYLPPGKDVAEADEQMIMEWESFVKAHSLPQFHSGMTWSFAAIYRETVEDVCRVSEAGCTLVEMEAATLYAIGHNKQIQALTLVVISDQITAENWIPNIKNLAVRNNLHQLADWALEFCSSLEPSISD